MESLQRKCLGQFEGFYLASWRGLGSVLILIALINILYILLQVIYNLYFHPLCKLPGPQLWIAFPILRYYAQIRGHLDRNICDFHEKYGNCVRWAPNQVTFTSAQAWKDIYGHGHAELQKHFPEGSGMDASNIMSADAHNHGRFRRAMLPAFSDKALSQQEPLIKIYVDLLITKLREVVSTDSPTNMVNWYSFTTFDLIGDLVYGESLNSLTDNKPNAWIVSIEKMMKLFPILILASLSSMLSKIILFLASDTIKTSRAEHLQRTTSLTMKRIEKKDQEHRGDLMDFMMRSRGSKHGLSDAELVSNSDTILVAGSETTATLLCGVTYFLLTNPPKMTKCTTEVRSAFSSEDGICFRSASSKLPYMLACLDEALRIFPPVPTVLSRQCPPGAPTPIDGKLMPPNSLVGVHHLSASHSAQNFHLPKRFIPERWLASSTTDPTSPFYNDDRNACKPFSLGPRDCVGRNLAYHEMRLILAKILWNFDLHLLEGCEEWADRQRTWALWEKPPLVVKITEREREE